MGGLDFSLSLYLINAISVTKNWNSFWETSGFCLTCAFRQPLQPWRVPSLKQRQDMSQTALYNPRHVGVGALSNRGSASLCYRELVCFCQMREGEGSSKSKSAWTWPVRPGGLRALEGNRLATAETFRFAACSERWAHALFLRRSESLREEGLSTASEFTRNSVKDQEEGRQEK